MPNQGIGWADMPGDFDRSPSPGEREAGACPQAWGKRETRLRQGLRTGLRGRGDEAGMRVKVQGRGIAATGDFRSYQPLG